MNKPYMLMLTAEQKATIKEAADLAGQDMSAWLRGVALPIAKEQIRRAKRTERQLKIG
jgi:uncharacterized protein (DUF1778 family)